MAHAARCETTKSFTPNILTKPPFIVVYIQQKYILVICTCVVQVNINRRTRRVKTHTQPILSDPLGMGWGWRRRRRRRQSRRQVRSSFSSRISYKMFLYIPREIWYHTYFINQPIHKEDDDDVKITKKGFQGVCVCVCVRCVYTA